MLAFCAFQRPKTFPCSSKTLRKLGIGVDTLFRQLDCLVGQLSLPSIGMSSIFAMPKHRLGLAWLQIGYWPFLNFGIFLGFLISASYS